MSLNKLDLQQIIHVLHLDDAKYGIANQNQSAMSRIAKPMRRIIFSTPALYDQKLTVYLITAPQNKTKKNNHQTIIAEKVRVTETMTTKCELM